MAVVNQRLARRFFPEGALGRRVGLVDGGATRWLRIVGVAPDLQYEEFGEDTAQSRLNVFVPYASAALPDDGPLRAHPRRRRGPRPRPCAACSARWTPGSRPGTCARMEEVRAYTTFEQRFFGKLMGAFAGQALLLACLGVYGVLAYGVSRRTHEIGVRLALGARPLDVIGLVVRQGATMAAAGVAAGLLLAVGAGPTHPGDPLRSELLGAAAALRDRRASSWASSCWPACCPRAAPRSSIPWPPCAPSSLSSGPAQRPRDGAEGRAHLAAREVRVAAARVGHHEHARAGEAVGLLAAGDAQRRAPFCADRKRRTP